MQLNPSEISELIKSRIQNLDTGAQMRTQGTVVSVTDGICRIHGLSDVMQGEMLEFPKNAFGLALVERGRSRLPFPPTSITAQTLSAMNHLLHAFRKPLYTQKERLLIA